MKPRLLALLCAPLVALLAACGNDAAEPTLPATATPAPSTTPEPAAGIPILSAEALIGEFRVAGIDGAEIAGDIGIALTIGEGVLFYEPRCLGYAWTLQMGVGGHLLLGRDPAFAPPAAPDSASCEPVVTPAFAQLAEALDTVDRAARTPANGIELTGGGRSVLLFSQ